MVSKSIFWLFIFKKSIDMATSSVHFRSSQEKETIPFDSKMVIFLLPENLKSKTSKKLPNPTLSALWRNWLEYASFLFQSAAKFTVLIEDDKHVVQKPKINILSAPVRKTITLNASEFLPVNIQIVLWSIIKIVYVF